LTALFAVPSAVSNKLLYFDFKICDILSTYGYIWILIILCNSSLRYYLLLHYDGPHLVESTRFISEGTQNPQLNTNKNTSVVLVFTVVYLTILVLRNHL
jgi:hypothetical protein